MRKIRTKSGEQRKQKRNQMIVGVVLVVVMFGSVFGVIVNSFGQKVGSQNVVYNNVEFVGQSGFWFASKDNFKLVFRNNPLQTEYINSDLNSLENYYGKPLYIYSNNEESKLEILNNLFYENGIVQRVQYACLEEGVIEDKLNCDGNFPLKNCDSNFILILEGEEEIVQNDNCVFIKGPDENLTQITDEFLFNLFGIKAQ